MRVKTRRYNLFVLERELRDALARLDAAVGAHQGPSPYVRTWSRRRRPRNCLRFRALVEDYEHADVLRVVLARAARSARRTTPRMRPG
jgi:hypothetical protein